MNKFGFVLGAAAVVTLAGCKDPDYKYANRTPSQGEVKQVETTPEPVAVKTTESTPAPAPSCTCAPGTKHTSPCACGGANCKCVVEKKPVVTEKKPVAAAPAYTEYIVQEGDYLAKISKRYNVTIASIRRLNPQIKKDVIRVGQKIKLPGTIDVGAQKTTSSAKAPAKEAKSAPASTTQAYTGATKEYVVKNGDTLGSIAYGNGINIRQLKKLNGITSDTLKVGQKLKIPAEKVVAAQAPAKKAAAPAAPVEKKSVAVAAAPAEKATVAAPAAPVETEKKAEAPVAAENATPAAAAPAATAAPETITYVVQEGEDVTAICVKWSLSAAQIRELNNLGENDQVVPGQILKLPAEAQQ